MWVVHVRVYETGKQAEEVVVLKGLFSGYSCREPEFSSQHLHGNTTLTLAVSPVPRDEMPSSGFCRHQACLWCRYIHVGKHSHTYINKSLENKRRVFGEKKGIVLGRNREANQVE